MKNVLKKPCRECPWRREHPAGWLGDYAPEWFTDRVLGETPVNCHLTLGDSTEIERLNKIGGEEAVVAAFPLCAGSLIIQRNMAKLPRDSELAKAVQSVERSNEVFGHTSEFLQHHAQK